MLRSNELSGARGNSHGRPTYMVFHSPSSSSLNFRQTLKNEKIYNEMARSNWQREVPLSNSKQRWYFTPNHSYCLFFFIFIFVMGIHSICDRVMPLHRGVMYSNDESIKVSIFLVLNDTPPPLSRSRVLDGKKPALMHIWSKFHLSSCKKHQLSDELW